MNKRKLSRIAGALAAGCIALASCNKQVNPLVKADFASATLAASASFEDAIANSAETINLDMTLDHKARPHGVPY